MKASLFIGIPIPYPVRKQLAALPHSLEHAKWSIAENFHLTLAFIGETERDAIDEITRTLQDLHYSQFALAMQGVDRFDKRVLWAGVTSHKELHDLHGQICALLDGMGVEFDHRPYRPHVTLARLRASVNDTELDAWMAEHKNLKSLTFMVEQFHLYESLSTPQGTRYIPLASFPLSAA